jgi:hypothetical protein
MARSGSTLQYNLACEMAEITGRGGSVGPSIFDDSSSDVVDDLARDEKLHVVKQHDVWPDMIQRIQRDDPGVRICYIYRDLRDVAVSMRNKWPLSWEAVIQKLDEAVATFEIVHEARTSAAVLWQRYEDVTADLPAATRDVADFLGLRLEADMVARIAEGASVEAAMAVAESLKGVISDRISTVGAESIEGRATLHALRNRTFRLWDPTTLIHHNHISRHKGASGVWRSELSAQEADRISTRYARWFRDTGYPV